LGEEFFIVLRLSSPTDLSLYGATVISLNSRSDGLFLLRGMTQVTELTKLRLTPALTLFTEAKTFQAHAAWKVLSTTSSLSTTFSATRELFLPKTVRQKVLQEESSWRSKAALGGLLCLLECL
jgi:hypothetical protein